MKKFKADYIYRTAGGQTRKHEHSPYYYGKKPEPRKNIPV